MAIRVREIWELASSDLSDAEARLDQMYSWRYDHVSARAKGILTLGTTGIAVVLTAWFGHKTGESYTPILTGGCGAAALVLVGVILYARLNRIYGEYVAAQRYLSGAMKVGALLRASRPTP